MSDTTSAVAFAASAALDGSDPPSSMPSSPATSMPSSPAIGTSSSLATSSTSTASSSYAAMPLSQAIHSINIKSLIPYTLDMQAFNYTKWRTLFLIVLGRFNLREHVEDGELQHDNPEWVQEILTVITCIYNTISKHLLDMLLKLKNPTAYRVWHELDSYSTGNKPNRAIIIEAEFQGFIRGQLSANEYCHRLQQMANALVDCDQPVTSPSAHPRTQHQVQHPSHTLPLLPKFPTFMEPRDLLIHDEMSHVESSDKKVDIALVATGLVPPSGASPQ